jgi:hypothetical protein
MVQPLQAGGGRLWRAVRRIRNWSLTAALGVSLVLGGVLAQSSLATAQPFGPALDPGFFPATGYRITSPAILDYFQQRGGVRTFGYPISNEFPLLGQRVQMFQRNVLQLAADGTVSPADLLTPDVLPVTHIDGLSVPAVDPDVVAAAPLPTDPDYASRALAFINVYVPDEWNGLAVNFQSTYLNTVTCADAFGSEACDPSLLPGFALEVWGLPTTLPMSDPLNPDFVYQRFQRGIMHFSRATGATQGLLIGDWLKRIMIGVDLSPDLSVEARGSRYFAQYAPSRPLALDRPAELPDTSLAQAFRADTLMAAGQSQPEPTLPTGVAATATAVALTATAISATQVALQNQTTFITATALALTATSLALQQTAVATPTPSGAVASDIPVINAGCLGDEQMWFVPRKANVGVHVQISVTSQRHHDIRFLLLAGPLDAGVPVERIGPLGFVWTWTIVPTIEGFYQWTFFADGLRPCITSGFNTFPPFGATETPTPTGEPTNTPGPTATPSPTPEPIPIVDTATQSGTCGSVVTIIGRNFGSPPSSLGTNVQLIAGPPNSGTPKLLTLLGGSNGQLTATLPSNGLTAGSGYFLVVSNSGGGLSDPSKAPFTVTGASC